MRIIELLWDELAMSAVEPLSGRAICFRPYSVGEPFATRKRVAVPIDPKLKGMSFFPVGTGLVGTRRGEPLPTPTQGGVMVVAHNWGSEGDCKRALAQDRYDVYLPTNRTIIALFEAAGIDPRMCFFTNAYSCLLRSTSAVGTLDIAAEDPFDTFSRAFLIRQCNLLRPSMIAVLGKPAARALARWFDVGAWQGQWTFPTLSTAGACEADIEFDGLRAIGVVIPHPSLPNWRYYSFNGARGRDAVSLALADAWRRAQSM